MGKSTIFTIAKEIKIQQDIFSLLGMKMFFFFKSKGRHLEL